MVEGANDPNTSAAGQRELGRGLLWLGTSNLLAKVLDALSAVFVLRFLSREELGVATLAWVTTTFVETFNGFGIGGAVIQSPALSDSAKASAHWYAVCTSALLMLLVYAAAPMIASLYELPQLVGLVQVSSVKLLLVGCANVPLAVASRGLRFERLGVIARLSTMLAAMLTILLAALGWGAWAPLLGNTAHGAFQLVGVFILAPLSARFAMSWPLLRPLARTGISLAGAGAVGQVARNLDYWMLGRVGGAAALGSYRIAFELAMVPMYTALQVASRSALPVYARLAGDPGRLGAAVAWTARTASLVLFAPLLVVFLEGDALLMAIGKASDPGSLSTTRLLCVAAFLRAVAQLALPALVAAGHSRLALVEALVSTLALAVSFSVCLALLAPLGTPVRMASGWLVACILLVPFELRLMRCLGAGVARELFRSLRAPVLVATATGLVSWVLAQLSPLPPGGQRALMHGLSILGLYALAVRYGLGLRFSELRPGAPGEAER